MSDVDDTPLFNLKAVVRETGLKPDTLRAWERRYGLPRPRRTSGGHRLYSQRDIHVLKWLMARQAEGMSISRAVDLWHMLEVGGQNPLNVHEYNAANGWSSVAPLPGGDALADLRDSWIEACLSFDEQTAERILAQSFALSSPEIVCAEVLQKGLAEIGERWYLSDATVQQEHFATGLAMRRLEALLAAAPAPTRSGRILVGCAPTEEHAFSALMLALLLRRQGRDVIYLGANIPMDRMEQTIATARPSLVILVAQQLYTAGTLLQMAEVLRKVRIPLAFGGGVFNTTPDLIERIHGHFLGPHLERSAEAVDQVLRSPFPLPSIEPIPADYQAVLTQFSSQHSQIDAHLERSLPDRTLVRAHLSIANSYLGRNIVTALQMGDLDCLNPEIEWLQGLLANAGIPQAMLDLYLRSYRDAAASIMGEAGSVLVNWLDQRVSEIA